MRARRVEGVGRGGGGEGPRYILLYVTSTVYGLQGQSIEPGAAIRMTD